MSPAQVAPATQQPIIRILSTKKFFEEVSASRASYLWGGLIPAKGVTLLVGNPKVGKTRLIALIAVGMRLAANRGKAVSLCGRNLQPGRAMIISLEHDPIDLRTKLEAAMQALLKKADLDIVYEPVDFSADDVLNAIALRAKKRAVNLIVVDSVRAAGDQNDNDSREVRQLLEHLRTLSRLADCAVVALHHPTKGSKDPRGSSDWGAGTDTVLFLSGKRPLRLEATHHRASDDEITFEIFHDKQEGMWAEAASPAKGKGVSQALKDEILRLCKIELRTEGSLRSLVRSAGIKAGSDKVKAAVAKLLTDGELEDVSTGRNPLYRTVDS